MEGESANALSINWAFGFSKDVINGVHSLVTRNRNALFFISSHSGVIYDFENRTQMILQGHCNLIKCCAVSKDKRWIVTADSGDDSILVVWDSMSGAPVKTIFSPHKYGVQCIDISDDSLFITTLGSVEPGTEKNCEQDISIWAWTKEDDLPILRQSILTAEMQTYVKFNTSNQSEFVTTGVSTVTFWTWQEMNIEGCVVKASKSDIGNYSGRFTNTIFLPGTSNALTSTSDGFTILWELQHSSILTRDSNTQNTRSASKVLRLVECAINVMATTTNGYLVIACGDGAVRYYDLFLRLEAWFEDLSAGSITSLSFSLQSSPHPEGVAGAPGLKFWVPDFIVGTADAFIVGVESTIFEEIRSEDRRGTLLVQGLKEEVSCVACHPSKTLVVLGCYNGSLQIWDYDMKLLLNLREFNIRSNVANQFTSRNIEKQILRPQCIAYEPHSAFIAVGFTSGNVKFIHSETFEDISSFAPTFDPVVCLKFSPSGLYLAGYDSSNHIIIFKKDTPPGVHDATWESMGEFVYVGRIISHKAPITGLEFGFRELNETLFSVGEDRICIEYDLQASSVMLGVLICNERPYSTKVESTARPTAMMWHPNIDEEIEDRFTIANDEFKFKELNADSKQCRKTTLTPTFGGPINCLIPIKCDDSVQLYAYSTASKVIGIGCLPLTGNPLEVMGLVAHPSTITSIAVSYDGKFLFSTGGSDLSANMWRINYEFWKEQKSEPSKSSMEPFINLLEGGEQGIMYNDIIDYFYYCQLRTQGEDTMENRSLTGTIPLEEIPSLVRAVGYYPSEEEVFNMINEIRYSTFMYTGELTNEINLDDTIKLFVNHRPAIPLSDESISSAFETISSRLNLPGDKISWDKLQKILMSEGESITKHDLEAYMSALVGEASNIIDDQTNFDAKLFADNILGFENS
jgi:WD40 repeat protein